MVLSAIPLLLATLLLTRLCRPRHRVEFLLIWAILLPASVFVLALAASAVGRLSSPGWWTAAGLLLLAGVALPVAVRPSLRARFLRKPAGLADVVLRIRRARPRHGDLALLRLCAAVVVLVGIVNLVMVVSLAPSTPDSLSYQLARVAYYLQQGHLGAFDANYWALVVHPKVSTAQMLYTYLITGRNENLMQLPQYLAYWAALLSVYGITRHLGGSRRGSLFAALAFGLLTICLAQAASPQNDLILTAFAGGTVYFLLAYREARRRRYLALAALAFALALGVKATMALVIPSLLVVAALLFLRAKGVLALPPRHLNWGAAALVMALCFITLPSGYGENWRLFGNPIGPRHIAELHSTVGADAAQTLGGGLRNLVRYSLEFLALDGLPPFPAVKAAQAALYAVPRALCQAVGFDAESPDFARLPFRYAETTLTSEAAVYWGILGFALVWPVVFLTVFGVVTRRTDLRLFALAALVFFVVQAFASPYDPWRGRYFITAALFALPPLAAVYLPRARWARAYLAVVVVVGCLSALFAAAFRFNTFLFSFTSEGHRFESVFTPLPPLEAPPGRDQHEFDRTLMRLKYLTRSQPSMLMGMVNYEVYVPRDAVIAVDVGEYGLEYLYFGEHLTRTLIPVRTIDGRWKAIPPEADFLLTADDSPYHQPDDLFLLFIDQPGFQRRIFLRPLR